MSSGYSRQEDILRSESPSLLPPPAHRHHQRHAQHIPTNSSEDHSGDGFSSVPQSCYERKQGCNRAFVWSWCLFTCGSMLFALLLIIPTLISIIMQEQICDTLCIPIPENGWRENIANADDWKMNNWITNSNRSQWPIELMNIYLYNITNSDAVMAGTESKLKIAVVGPYSFQVYRQKYNITFSEDNERVFYEDLESHTFIPGDNGLLLSDKITTLDMILVSVSWFQYTVTNYPMISIFDYYCAQSVDLKSCLFQKTLTVQEILFGYSNLAYFVGQGVMPKEFTLAPLFSLFFNYSRNLDEAHQMHLKSSYGLGGELHLYSTTLHLNLTGPLVNISGPPTLNDSIVHGQYTGQENSFGQIMEYFQISGNDSIQIWNSPEAVGGTDHFQFTPPVTPESLLRIWDPDIIRRVDLKFQQKVSVLGKYDAYRFIPTSDLFSGTDPKFFGQVGYEGLAFASPVSNVHYCSPIPGYASRPFLAGVNSALANTVECINCPDMSNPDDWLESYMDIEPNTGKVIGGKKRGQINVMIGQQEIYNSTHPGAATLYRNVPLTLLPVVYFEYSSMVEEGDQTNQLDDGLNQIHLASTATLLAEYVLSSLAALIYLSAFIVGAKAEEHGACFDRARDKSGLKAPLL